MTGRITQARDRTIYILYRVIRRRQHLKAKLLQVVLDEGRLPFVQDHQVRMQNSELLQVGIMPSAEARQFAYRRGISAVVRDADDLVKCADVIENFGHVRRQRDNSPRRRGVKSQKQYDRDGMFHL